MPPTPCASAPPTSSATRPGRARPTGPAPPIALIAPAPPTGPTPSASPSTPPTPCASAPPTSSATRPGRPRPTGPAPPIGPPRLAATAPPTRPTRIDRVGSADQADWVDRADRTSGRLPTALVANLPYNVAVPVVLHLLAELPGIRRGLVMVQAEVAERLAAAPGSRAYGVPSAKLAWFAAARRAGPVPRSVFWPVPGVDSGLLAFDRHPPPPGDRAAVFAVVDAAFAQRRKVLRSALAGWAGSPTAAEAALRAADVDPGARAETLTIADFARIAAR